MAGAKTMTRPDDSVSCSRCSDAVNISRPPWMVFGDSAGVTVTVTVVPNRDARGWVSIACTRTVATIANAAPSAATASTAGQRTEPTHRPTPTTAATATTTAASAAHGPHYTPTAVTVQ